MPCDVDNGLSWRYGERQQTVGTWQVRGEERSISRDVPVGIVLQVDDEESSASTLKGEVQFRREEMRVVGNSGHLRIRDNAGHIGGGAWSVVDGVLRDPVGRIIGTQIACVASGDNVFVDRLEAVVVHQPVANAGGCIQRAAPKAVGMGERNRDGEDQGEAGEDGCSVPELLWS